MGIEIHVACIPIVLTFGPMLILWMLLICFVSLCFPFNFNSQYVLSMFVDVVAYVEVSWSYSFYFL